MSTELLNVIENLEREKGISREVLIQSVEAALVSAARKVVHDKDKEIEVKIDLGTGRIRILSEGKEIVSNEFGRIAAQTAKQVIFQKIREAERDVILANITTKWILSSVAPCTVLIKGRCWLTWGKPKRFCRGARSRTVTAIGKVIRSAHLYWKSIEP